MKVEVTIAEAKKILETVGVDRVLLIGPPGIGKSTIVVDYAREKARKLGLEFADARTVSKDDLEGKFLFLHLFAPTLRPEDLAFIAKKGDRYDFVLPHYLDVFTKEGVHGVIFIDEITNVQLADVLTVLFSLILDKSVAGYKLSENVEIIAAGNAPDESSVANQLPAPLVDRFRYVVKTAPPTVEEWLDYMTSRYGDEFDQRVTAFLLVNKEALAPRGDSESLEKTPTPRTWTQFALDLLSIPDDMLPIISASALGRKYGAEFYEFTTTQVNVGELLKGNQKYFDSLTIKEQYIAIYYAARKIVEGANPCGFADILLSHREFGVIFGKMLKSIDRKKAHKIILRCDKLARVIADIRDLTKQVG